MIANPFTVLAMGFLKGKPWRVRAFCGLRREVIGGLGQLGEWRWVRQREWGDGMVRGHDRDDGKG